MHDRNSIKSFEIFELAKERTFTNYEFDDVQTTIFSIFFNHLAILRKVPLLEHKNLSVEDYILLNRQVLSMLFSHCLSTLDKGFFDGDGKDFLITLLGIQGTYAEEINQIAQEKLGIEEVLSEILEEAITILSGTMIAFLLNESPVFENAAKKMGIKTRSEFVTKFLTEEPFCVKPENINLALEFSERIRNDWFVKMQKLMLEE